MSDEIIKTLLAQAPAVAVLVYALYTVYNDFKVERASAAAERAEMIKQLTIQTVYMRTLASALKIDLPSEMEIVARNMTPQ